MNEKFDAFLNQVQGKAVTVLGMGVSNTPLIRLLADHGAQVTVRDKKALDELDQDLVQEYRDRGVQLRCGPGYLDGLDGQIIFKTPGMRPDLPELVAARARGSFVTSEMDVFVHVCPCPIIGVTGSDGKTTTTSVIHALLTRQGRKSFVGGNIGAPLLSRTGEISPGDRVVLELSSFQLMTMTKSPDTAVITNITPNHLDVHASMEEYIDAKCNIFRFQGADGRVVLNLDNALTREIYEGLPESRRVGFSRAERLRDGFFLERGVLVRARNGVEEPVLAATDIKIPGLHNVENYLAAIAAVDGLVDPATVRAVAREFGGVPHRMELVGEVDGVRYYNDSIASSPTRTIAGLRAFDRKVILIAGGYDKHIPFDVLGPEVVEHVKCLVLTGATADKIAAAVRACPGFDPQALPIRMCRDLAEAVDAARRAAQPGDIVTLSPACASFDCFKNFEERGDRFRALVGGLK